MRRRSVGGRAQAEVHARDEACPCFAAQGKRNSVDDVLGTGRAPCIRTQEMRQTLGENAARTVADGAPKATRAQDKAQYEGTPGQVRWVPLILAMHA